MSFYSMQLALQQPKIWNNCAATWAMQTTLSLIPGFLNASKPHHSSIHPLQMAIHPALALTLSHQNKFKSSHLLQTFKSFLINRCNIVLFVSTFPKMLQYSVMGNETDVTIVQLTSDCPIISELQDNLSKPYEDFWSLVLSIFKDLSWQDVGQPQPSPAVSSYNLPSCCHPPFPDHFMLRRL